MQPNAQALIAVQSRCSGVSSSGVRKSFQTLSARPSARSGKRSPRLAVMTLKPFRISSEKGQREAPAPRSASWVRREVSVG